MTPDCKKNFNTKKWQIFEKKNQTFAQKSDGFWPGKIIFFIES